MSPPVKRAEGIGCDLRLTSPLRRCYAARTAQRAIPTCLRLYQKFFVAADVRRWKFEIRLVTSAATVEFRLGDSLCHRM